MKRIGTITYNKYCNFTNYGSALQTWALLRVLNGLSPDCIEAICIDYCPKSHEGADPLNPLPRMWDRDAESRCSVEASMPSVRKNYEKVERFYETRCSFTRRRYTYRDVGEAWEDEGLSGYVCGSDTIFCIREFSGFDRGYFADAPEMRGRSVAYAASFGDVDWNHDELKTLSSILGNFRALGLRENGMVGFARDAQRIPVVRTCDPTLLLHRNDYLDIAAERQHEGRYVLLYSRRYDPLMEDYVERVAKELGCGIVEISLRASNADRGHDMRYDAGVEEYLALVRDAEYVVTNSYHGLAFAMQMHTPFTVFTREQADTKISELLDWVGLSRRQMVSTGRSIPLRLGFAAMDEKLQRIREESLAFLKYELELLEVL